MSTYDLGDGVILHGREEWAQGRQVVGSPDSRAVSEITEFIVHHSGGVTLGDPDPFQWVRNIYDYHVHQLLYCDVAYEAFVTLHNGIAFVIEGRPITLCSAATYEHNRQGYAACYLRANADIDTDGFVPPQVKVAYRKLAQVIAFTAGHTLAGLGHRDCKPDLTFCPGDDLDAWVHANGLWQPFPAPKGAPKPSPAPMPHPGPPPVPTLWGGRWPGYDLKEGARGPVVTLWQARMNQLGGGLALDGIFGTLTAATTRFFQAARKLPASGVVDYATWVAAEHG